MVSHSGILHVFWGAGAKLPLSLLGGGLKPPCFAVTESHQHAFQIRLKLFGEDHSDTALSYDNFGVAQDDRDERLQVSIRV